MTVELFVNFNQRVMVKSTIESKAFDGSKDRNFPPIIIVEDDNLLGISLKRYLEQTLKPKFQRYSSAEDSLNELAKKQPP